jgi:hypothetical protein
MENKKIVKKETKGKRIIRTMSDMEMEGVYFPEVKKDPIENLCHYSGLPSVMSYGQ